MSQLYKNPRSNVPGGEVQTLSAEGGPATAPTLADNYNFSGSIAGGSAANGAIQFITPGGPGAATNGQMDAVVRVDGTTIKINASNQLSAITGTLAWTTITASQTLATDHGYICVSAGGALALALPASSAVGDIIEVTLDGATSWSITQGVGQQIRMGSSQTTSGAGGSLTSTAQGDSIRMVCSVANTKWNVLSSMGNLTVV